MFDHEAFLEELHRRKVTLKAIASALGINPSTLYRKATGQSEFTRSEIQKCCEFLGEKELNRIFFAREVT